MESIEQYPDPFTEEQVLGDGMEIRSEVGSESDSSEEEDGEKEKLGYAARRHSPTLYPPDPDDDIANSPREPVKPFTQAEERTTIHISNLPITTTREDLLKFYQKFGPIKFVRLRSMKDQLLVSRKQIQGDPFMTAYVVFALYRTEKAAGKAMWKTNKTQFMGHVITVTRPVHPIAEFKRSVCVSNLPMTATTDDLVATFQPLGEIYSAKINRNQVGERVGYVSFLDLKAIARAIKLNGSLCVKGQQVNVTKAREIYKTDKMAYRARRGIPEMKTVHEMKAGRLVRYRIPKNEEAKQLLMMKKVNSRQGNPIAGSGQNYPMNSSVQRGGNVPNWQRPAVSAPPITTGNYISFTDSPVNQGRRQQKLQPGNAYLDNQRWNLLSVPLNNGQVKIPSVRKWRKEDMVWRNPNLTQ